MKQIPVTPPTPEEIQKKRTDFDEAQMRNLKAFPFGDSFTGLGDKDLAVLQTKLLLDIKELLTNMQTRQLGGYSSHDAMWTSREV